MDKINKEIIEAKLRLHEIEKQKKNLDEEYQYLQDKIHLYFDSPNIDTTEAEKFIISYFWQNAYREYKDGGYITNDEFISDVRFRYECELIKKIINRHCIKRRKALDLGCGNGRYTRFLAKFFDEVVGADLSEHRIEQNIKENKLKNVSFTCKDAMDLKSEKFDFVFASDIFMYIADKDIEDVFQGLLKLVKKDQILLTRDSIKNIGNEAYRSKNYIAYYRNFKFYTMGIFEKYFEKYYKNSGYNLYHLNKFFNVHKEKKAKVYKDPSILDSIVLNSVDSYLKTSHFYVYKV